MTPAELTIRRARAQAALEEVHRQLAQRPDDLGLADLAAALEAEVAACSIVLSLHRLAMALDRIRAAEFN